MGPKIQSSQKTDQFYRCQSMSQVVSLQPWEFIASQSPGIVFPDQVASETEGGVLLQGLGYLEASIKALSIIVDHNFSGWKTWFWPSKFEFTTSGCFWDHFSLPCWQALEAEAEWWAICLVSIRITFHICTFDFFIRGLNKSAVFLTSVYGYFLKTCWAERPSPNQTTLLAASEEGT